MLDLTTEFDARVNQRLLEDDVIWFTTVSPNGTPTPNPIRFQWDGEIIIVYSQPESYRVPNIKQNPKVSLHLEGADALGHKVIIINGDATLHPDCKKVLSGYEVRYKKNLPSMHMTADELVAAFSVEIRVKPVKVRGSK
jgi:PPOX class probable F420-dependent enzyme